MSENSRIVWRVLAVAGAVIVLILLGRRIAGLVPEFVGWVQGLGPLGVLVFIAGYIAAAVAFLPGSILTLAAGAIFGVAAGVLYVFIGATLGAAAAFLVARHLARRAIERRLTGNDRFAAIDRAVGRQGLKIVFLLRLSPVFPYNLLNYALGLTSIGIRDFVIASVGMLPGTFLYVYYGKLIGDVAALAAGARVPRDTGYYVLLAAGLIATVAVTAVVTRTARRALRDATGGEVGASAPGTRLT